MSLKLLTTDILKYNPKARIKLVEKAYRFAEQAHSGQKRKTGEPYFNHPYEVAGILIELNADSATIVAALLHDTVEEAGTRLDTIKQEFGKEISDLVEGVTKIDKVHFEDKEDYTAENLRKIMLATAKDVRVMLIRLADRLHNMRTLKTFREAKQKRIAQETLDIYAPIAQKLGMWNIKGELEDLSLRILDPTTYRFLANKIQDRREQREANTENTIRLIKRKLKEKGIEADVQGRAKYFYSIYKKMMKKNMDFNDIYDLTAVRIITKTIPECYTSLGVVHELFKPLPRRFKDYIAIPKSNGYQSLHTAVVESQSKILELQLRTEQMHAIAEDGVAAHWRYHGTERDKKFDKKISWLKQLLEWKRRSKDAQDFIETLKMDLFESEIVVFTPKGDPITLPEGSTPIDFAYEVHTSLGEKCSKAFVNRKLVPLDHGLQPGDIVEIMVNKNVEPSRQWLHLVKTNKAKNKIRAYLKIESDKPAKALPAASSKERADTMVVLTGRKAPVKIAKCCQPKPGVEIVGFPTKDRKVTVHRQDCQTVKKLDKEKLIQADWSAHAPKGLKLRITVKDRVGVLAEMLNLIAQYKVNIRNVNTKAGKEKYFTVLVEIDEPPSLVFEKVLSRMRSVRGVMEVRT